MRFVNLITMYGPITVVCFIYGMVSTRDRARAGKVFNTLLSLCCFAALAWPVLLSPGVTGIREYEELHGFGSWLLAAGVKILYTSLAGLVGLIIGVIFSAFAFTKWE